MGSANTLDDDRDRAFQLFEETGRMPDMIVACNHAARDWSGRLDHWVTMHPELFPLWLHARRRLNSPDPGQLWAARHRPVPDGLDVKPVESWGGSSGLLCVTVALQLGAQRIVLAGVPMRKTARHYDNDQHWQEARGYWPAWERLEPRLQGKVKSMSGWTADLLGMPTEDWLRG